MIAIRVWKSPLLFVDSGSLGGMNGTPLIGDADTIAAEMACIQLRIAAAVALWIHPDHSLRVCYAFQLLLWSRDRKAKLFLWLAIFTATPVLLSVLQGQFPIPVFISYGWGRGLNQPIYVLNHIALWYLLLWLLRLNGNRTLVRWTKGGCLYIHSGGSGRSLAFFWGRAGPWMQGRTQS